MLVFRQLFDPPSSTYTYLLADGGNGAAVIIDPVFEQVMLVGEGRPFLTLLAVTKEGDEQALLAHANERLKDFPRWVRIRHCIATSDPWSIENGLLTPTLKLKRPLVLAKFKDALDAVMEELR